MMSNGITETPPVALTIAGFDPSGGAGVVADVKTFTAFGCFAAAAVTSLTYQNTTGVFGAAHQTAEAVRAQVMPVVEDFTVAGAKTGMLPTREIIAEVARLFRETELPAPVVDPVVRSTSGFDLIDDAALDALKRNCSRSRASSRRTSPRPSASPAFRYATAHGMLEAARAIRALGARAVLVKGGHLEGDGHGRARRRRARHDVHGPARRDDLDARHGLHARRRHRRLPRARDEP